MLGRNEQSVLCSPVWRARIAKNGQKSRFDRIVKAGILCSSDCLGGEGGIRTLGTGVSPYNGLANRRIRPLCHLSGMHAENKFNTWVMTRCRLYRAFFRAGARAALRIEKRFFIQTGKEFQELRKTNLISGLPAESGNPNPNCRAD